VPVRSEFGSRRAPVAVALESDIPWSSMSSCGGGLVVCPGGGLVVVAAGLGAAVQDADQSVPELPQRCVVAQGVVVGAGAG
jgi:hypothetical protein